jgi:uncharacterized protein (TIGR02391 family)
MDISKLRMLFGRLKGIKEIISVQNYTTRSVGDDYNSIVDLIANNLSEDLSSFKLTGQYFYRSAGAGDLCHSYVIRDKLFQLISFLEYGYNLSEHVIEIGSIYNSIIDEELKARCSDILSAPSNFDRVINQSTQVLEDRIREKAKTDRNLVGVSLVNKALNTDLSKTIIVTSTNQEEHEGICHICRGLMVGFRNPSHHHLTDSFTREEALKFCAFVDNILQIIDKSEINKGST